MSSFKEFIWNLIGKTTTNQAESGVVSVYIDANLYMKELALYTCISLIGNAISRSEILCFENNKQVKNENYYRLNVSPNDNETSSLFWHRVINKMVRKKEALVVELSDGRLYLADSFTRVQRPILGDIYENIQIGNISMNRSFDKSNSYLFCLNDENISQIINGVYEEWGNMLATASDAFQKNHGSRYKLIIEGAQSGDTKFNKEFIKQVKENLKPYLTSKNAVAPIYAGYELVADDAQNSSYSSEDYIKLRKDMFETFFSAFHIPISMASGNITNMKEIVTVFLSFAVDPFADTITESINKAGGIENFKEGNRYKVDTSYNNHRDIFELASQINALISSGCYCIDEIREKIGDEPLNTTWSKNHFMTKNFDEINNLCTTLPVEGGE